MKPCELKNFLNIDYEEALENRFMDSEELYAKFLRRLLTSEDFKLLSLSLTGKNFAEAFRYAHNLKGVCANLGLVGLAKTFSELVELLRENNFTQHELAEKFSVVNKEWERTLAYLEKINL